MRNAEQDYRGEPNCQSIAGPQIDNAIGIAEQMASAAVELTLDFRREIEARYEEADQLRCRRKAQIEADLAPRRFPFVDPIIVSAPIRSKVNGTTSTACWLKLVKMPSAQENGISSSSMKLSASADRNDGRVQ